MPLSEFFADQFRQIRSFLGEPAAVVRIIRVDPDMRYVLLKALVKLDDEPDNPHIMLFADAPFASASVYFAGLSKQLQQNHAEHEAALRERGVRIPAPAPDAAALHPAHQFRLYASAVADALPDSAGSLVFVLDPSEVADRDGFRQCVEFLGHQVESKWLKFLVLDSRLEPRLDGLDGQERIGTQSFYMSPEAIEQKLKEQARKPSSDPLQHRRTLGVLAGFAFSNKNYDEAARLQAEWASLAEAGGAPAEAASAYYNLGNTLLEQGDLLKAEETFVKSCELCLAHAVNGVLPLALTNLGITLFRQNRVDEAVESLRTAYRHFKAQNHKPGEAFVYDALARAYYELQRHDEAEQAWLRAYSVYDAITSDAFADLRKSGCDDIAAKLERFYEATGRRNRLTERPQPPPSPS
jgi:tetratricopeptide (TPR) repeat protein